jgi:SAM-dependent methyltransferase
MNNQKLQKFIQPYLKHKPLFFSLIRPQEAYLFNKYTEYLQSPILDFGCGDGFFVDVTFGKRKIEIGLDLKAIKNKVYQKVKLYDGKRIPFPNNYFSTVISNCVLEHIPNLDLILSEIYRVLKPNGYFVTTVLTNHWENNLIGKKIIGSFYSHWLRRKQKHHQLLTLSQWRNKFKKNHLKMVEEIGYVSPKNSQYLEIYHYLSLFGWLGKKLFRHGLDVVELPTDIATSSALFFVAKK